jgi:ABC-type amino acid transport substrate-binding protein
VAVNERVPRIQLLGGLAAVGALLLTGCTSASGQEPVVPTPEVDTNADALAAMLDPCAKPNLTTVEPGAITFATSAVPAPPFFLTDDPSDREGFDADLAYSLAEVLGFRSGQVTWEYVPVDEVLSGEFVDYDLALGGLSATEAEGSPVVFSQPYLVVDADVLPGATREASANEDGELSATAGVAEVSFALVSGNPLLACTDRALDEMSEDGTLDGLGARWLDPQ